MAIVNNLIVNGSSSITGNLGVKNKISSNSIYGSNAVLNTITMTGTLYLANNTWNNIGDDIAFGDINMGGHVGFKNLNSTSTGIVLINKDDGAKRTTLTSDANGNFTITPTAATYINGYGSQINVGLDITIDGTNSSGDGDIGLNSNHTVWINADTINTDTNNINLIADSTIAIQSSQSDIVINADTTLSLYGNNEITMDSDDIYLNANNNIYVKFGSASSMTLENYIKGVTENARLIDNASKNLLNFNALSYTGNGITFTVNKNNNNATTKVEVSGTATDYTYIESSSFVLPAGNYILNGYNSTSGLFLSLRDGTTSDLIGITTNGEYRFTSDGSQSYKVRIYVDSGFTISLSSIYPMLRRAEIIDDTFEPYYKTNKQLDSDLNSLTDKMSYNLLNISHDAGDYFILSGINYSVNKDDKYGTAVTSIVLKSGTANADANIVLNTDTFLENGKQYYLSGCPAGSDGNYSLSYGNYYDSGNGVIFTASQNTSIKINVKSGLTVNNLTFYPMITELLYKNKPFKPYITNLNDYIKVYDNSIMNISMPVAININGQSESINSTTTYYSDPDTGEFETKQAGLNVSSTNINLSYDYQKFRDLDFKSQTNSLSITEQDITLSVSSQNTGNKNAMIKIDATTGNIYIQVSNTNTITLKEYIQGIMNGTY